MRLLGQEIRYALRGFRRRPGFPLVTVLVLGLAIGANTAVFSIFDALVLRQIPAREPKRLVELAGRYRNGARVPFSYPMFQEMERGERVFSSLLGWSGQAELSVEAEGTWALAGVRAVSGNFCAELGARPLLGRLIEAEDTAGGAPLRVAVISYEFWERRFGGDPGIVGKAIRIEARPFTIVGVTRKGFTGITPGEAADLMVPITAGPFDAHSRSSLWVHVAGRLKDGIRMEPARAQLASFWPELLAATVPTGSPGERRRSFFAMRLEVEPAAGGARGGAASALLPRTQLLAGMAGLILLVVCVNLAGLGLARAAGWSEEMSTRAALGASAAAMVRPLLVETGLLTIAGGLLGLGAAEWGGQLLIGLMAVGARYPLVLDLRPDTRVFAFTLGVAALSALLIGLGPAWRICRQQPLAGLPGSDRTLGRGPGSWGKVLVVAQIAATLVLLQGAGLFLRTWETLRWFDPGFEKAGVIELSLEPRAAGYQGVDLNSYRRELVRRVAAAPGVLRAAYSNLPVPARDQGWRDTVSLTEADTTSGTNPLATLEIVSPEFLRTLRIPLLAGRDFDWSDDGQHPAVAIIDGQLSRRLGDAAVVGRRIRFGVQPEFQNLEIVGVARSARLLDPRKQDAPILYVPSGQHPGYSRRGHLFARALDKGAAIRSAQRAIGSLGYEYAAVAQPLEQWSERALSQERATATLASWFAGFALLLAAMGIFGLMSHSVVRRTREVGIRVALGSQRAGILWMILGETLGLTLAGVAIGVPCAVGAARLAAHLLFGLSPADPATLAAVSAVLLGTGAMAGYWPARRAMRMDPVVALRWE